jgi:enoyl-CoA hydratase/carnithine racemase
MASPFALNEFKQLSLNFDNGVLSLALNRPEKKNAIGVDMTLEIERLLKQVAASNAVKVLLIRGMHGNFSTGMDMKDFFDHSDRDPSELARARHATNHWRSRQLRLLSQPIICAVEGYCLGGAFPILECATWVVASDTAIFGLPEINFGFVPGGPIAKSVGLAMTRRGASYASLSGRNFSAHQAKQWGLVSHVCTADKCLAIAEEAAHAVAQHLSEQPTTDHQKPST